MPAIITEIIPKQGFEIVGEQIGAVLALEVANQVALQALANQVGVFHERVTPFDKSEEVMINVQLDSGNYDNHTESNVQEGTIFNIDIYASAASSSGKPGDLESSKLLQKFLGMCRYILQSTKYRTLALPAGTIGGTYVDSFQIYDQPGPNEGKSSRMARLVFRVRIYENQQLWGSTALSGGDTSVKLDLTDKGYKYILT